jgi:hypothetical protein
MVIVLTSSGLDLGFGPRSGQTKDQNIGTCCKINTCTKMYVFNVFLLYLTKYFVFFAKIRSWKLNHQITMPVYTRLQCLCTPDYNACVHQITMPVYTRLQCLCTCVPVYTVVKTFQVESVCYIFLHFTVVNLKYGTIGRYHLEKNQCLDDLTFSFWF